MSASDSNTERGEDNSCPVCHNCVEIYAVGPCNHFVCYVCYVRMKFLCDQMDCPICRKDLKQVAFTRRKTKFDLLDIHAFLFESKEGIFSEDLNIQKTYKDLLKHRCSRCKNMREFESFKELKSHMNNQHQLYSCELCSKHLKLFSSERKFYTRQELLEHKKTGDANDRSYKGHPLCEFCNERYFDNDALLTHLRKDHFFCHFCETDGVTGEFYCEYKNLHEHFRESHYLCEIDQCASVQWSNAFRSELDLKIHIAKEHSKGLSKTQAKQLRNFDLGFSYSPHPSQVANSRGRGGRRGGREGHEFSRGRYGGREGRGGRGARSHNDRQEMETAHLLASSLAHGNVAVIDPELGRMLQSNGQLSQTSTNVSSDSSQSSKPQETLSWVNNNEPAAAAAAFQSEFPSLHTQQKPKPPPPITKKGKEKPENASMAAWLAHSVGMNVREGEFFNKDFPSLPTGQHHNSKQHSKQSVWNKAEANVAPVAKVQAKTTPLDDFPDLQLSTKSHRATEAHSSLGKFEVLKKQPHNTRANQPSKQDAPYKLSSKESSIDSTSDLFTNGSKRHTKGTDERREGGGGGLVNTRLDPFLESKAGSWKQKKNDVHEDGETSKMKADGKQKKGKGKVKGSHSINNVDEQRGSHGESGGSSRGLKGDKVSELEKRVQEKELELEKDKQAIENQKKILAEEREKIKAKLLEEQKKFQNFSNTTSSSESTVQPSSPLSSQTSVVPPGFQKSGKAPPGFNLLTTSTSSNFLNDFPPLPNAPSIPPGFKKL